MAAVALLRSVASKITRAPPTLNRPLLARGLHGGARLGLRGSLPQPPTSSESRFVLGAAPAAGLRSLTATLPTPHHRLLHERGLRSRSRRSPNSGVFGSTPPPNSRTDIIRTTITKATNGFVAVTLLVVVIYMYGRLLPALDRLGDKFDALKREKSNLIDILTQAIEAMELLLPEVNDKEPVGETGKGVVDNLEEAHRHFKELEAAIKNIEAEIPELKDLQAKITKLKTELESVHSKRKV
ncbi:unnamed protein product [Urochloa decumbens]|uniref:Uncharacterized protein n=1 Tax=Urochloa decumbens TaxID=240449 RepID=A0ABC8YS78_9POAL